jgi:branched-chain amino acid transport system permease protein
MKTDSTIMSDRSSRSVLFSRAQYILILVVLILLPFFIPEFFRSILSKIYIFAIFAMSVNIIMGYTGMVTLGHAVFLGIGGYTMGILMVRLGIHSLWVLYPAALVAAAIVAAFVGFIALRVSGMHFIIITIAFGQLFYAIAVKWRAVTGSTDGLIGINYPAIGLFSLQWTSFSFHYFILFIFVLCYLAMYIITNSSFGYALVGIRENENRMQGLGYNTWLYKYLAFIVAGVFAGLAGALFAPFYRIMVPSHFALLTSATAVLMMTLGSPGTLYGPFIGSVMIVLIEFFASAYVPERWPLILGGIFIICISLFRGGVGIYLARAWGKLRNKLWKC